MQQQQESSDSNVSEWSVDEEVEDQQQQQMSPSSASKQTRYIVQKTPTKQSPRKIKIVSCSLYAFARN